MALSEVGTTRAIGLFCQSQLSRELLKKEKKDLDLWGRWNSANAL
jgi:hypothetical protein